MSRSASEGGGDARIGCDDWGDVLVRGHRGAHPAKHPIRVIRHIVNEVLGGLDADFAAMYAPIGRPSIAPEKLLRASLLQAFFTVRSERLLMKRLDYDLMFRWFVGLGIDDPVWDHSTFSKIRDRLLEADIARLFPQRHP